ncbi:MAG: metallophosphoesterase [Muribaculaceae bacterium]|nr:metallophosphoesterase [Muribaculaceae bacterium]
MRLPLLAALIVLIVNLAVDYCIYRCLRRHALLRRAHVVLSALMTLVWIGVICVPKKLGDDAFMLRLMWTVYAYWTVYVPKYLALLFEAVASVPLLFGRRKWRWVQTGGVALGCVAFVAMWWGSLVERYRIDVREVQVEIPGLPRSMQGLRIVQISDWHVGSYGHSTSYIDKCIRRINELHPDLVVFTGDIVNRHSDELRPYIDQLSQLKAPMGVYSVMGNHDYGDYYAWPDEQAHRADADSLRAIQRRMGWHMLDNSTVMLRRGDDSLALIGVENIGEPPFVTRGSLLSAYPTPSDSVPKILLSHNPRHWTDSIAGHADRNIALTLSGHTHAMQMRIAGASPASLRYPTWGGLYTDSLGRKLYVNIGLGTVGVPMRIGATPEITLFVLQ